jgi:hypothetical protein
MLDENGVLAQVKHCHLVMDNTYCNPSCTFPSREEALKEVLAIVSQHKETHKIVLGIDTLGKEEILVALAEALDARFLVSKSRYFRLTEHLGINRSYFLVDPYDRGERTKEKSKKQNRKIGGQGQERDQREGREGRLRWSLDGEEHAGMSDAGEEWELIDGKEGRVEERAERGEEGREGVVGGEEGAGDEAGREDRGELGRDGRGEEDVSGRSGGGWKSDDSRHADTYAEQSVCFLQSERAANSEQSAAGGRGGGAEAGGGGGRSEAQGGLVIRVVERWRVK